MTNNVEENNFEKIEKIMEDRIIIDRIDNQEKKEQSKGLKL